MRKAELTDRIIKELQGDLPLVSRPYQDIAERIGVTEEEVIAAVAELRDQGLLKRIGAVLKHQQAGYDANAMVAWKVPEADIDRIGGLMAAEPRVSHCYWRETPTEWPFQLFAMVHGRSREELDRIIQGISRTTGLVDYKVVESVRELKKTSVQYR